MPYKDSAERALSKKRWSQSDAGKEFHRARAERARRAAGIPARTSCPCDPCSAERYYQELRRVGDPEAYKKSRVLGKDYDVTCPCGRCVRRAEFYRTKYLKKKGATVLEARNIVATTKRSKYQPTRPKLDRLDLIAMKDPIISQGRQPYHAT